jgi:hypothetical protein
MRAMFRAGLIAMLAALLCGSALAADKAFQRDDLADAAIRLEAEIKNDSGQITSPLATLRRDADAAFSRNDYRSAFQLLGRIVTVAPNDSAAWLRLARAILQVQPRDDRERSILLARAATAAYVAYQRTGNRGEEAEALDILGRTYSARRIWRPALDTLRLSLELNENADVRGRYERMREDHGFRLIDYTVDSDAASPRACLQFSERLPGRRTDLSPFVSVAGMDKPALSADDRQLCVEGLKHGERYAITVRAGLPSVVQESLQKSADLTIYVRDRKPFVQMTGKAYVLPRSGQRGRHSDRQRQHPADCHRDLPRRRPQSHRHCARFRLPAEPRPLRARPLGQCARLEGVERGARGRRDAQRRRDDRLSHRSGSRRSATRRLCHGC